MKRKYMLAYAYAVIVFFVAFWLGYLLNPHMGVYFWSFRLKHSNNPWVKLKSANRLANSELGRQRLLNIISNSKSKDTKYYSLFALFQIEKPWIAVSLLGENFYNTGSSKEYSELLGLLDYSKQHLFFLNSLHYEISSKQKGELVKAKAKEILQNFSCTKKINESAGN